MIPINDLQRIDTTLLEELKDAVNSCFLKGWYLLGPETQAFEQEFANYCGTKNCITVANGTDAIEISLRALGIKEGDQVATVANAGMYSTIAIRNIGAKPFYIEIDPETMNMDPASLQKQLLPQTKAIIVTHLYGQLAEIEEIINIAQQTHVPVIEDCAQAHGAIVGGKKAGSFADVGCFSFYPTKNLGAMGDAGAIVTKHQDLAEKMIQLRQYGWEKKYYASLAGGKNSRIDEMQAAILRKKLKYLDIWNEKRRDIAERYREGLSHLPIKLPTKLDKSYVGHLYVIRSPQRDALRDFLIHHQVNCEIHYPIPDYLQASVRSREKIELTFTEKSCNEVLTLPCFPELKREEIESVINKVSAFFEA